MKNVSPRNICSVFSRDSAELPKYFHVRSCSIRLQRFLRPACDSIDKKIVAISFGARTIDGKFMVSRRSALLVLGPESRAVRRARFAMATAGSTMCDGQMRQGANKAMDLMR